MTTRFCHCLKLLNLHLFSKKIDFVSFAQHFLIGHQFTDNHIDIIHTRQKRSW